MSRIRNKKKPTFLSDFTFGNQRPSRGHTHRQTLSGKVFIGKTRSAPKVHTHTSTSKTMRKNETWPYVKYFILAVIALIIIGFSLKLYALITTSRFTHSTFTILVLGKGNHLTKVDSKTNRLSILEIEHIDQSLLTHDPETLSYHLGIPIDGVVYAKNDFSENFKDDFFSFSSLFGVAGHSLRGLNSFDLFKMRFIGSYFAKDVSTASLKSLTDEDDIQKIDTELRNLFADSDIVNEKYSVEILNASGINGVGNKYARMLRNNGFNVIAVRSEEESDKSIFIVGKSTSYSARVLSSIISLPAQVRYETSVADATIVISTSYAQEVLKEARE